MMNGLLTLTLGFGLATGKYANPKPLPAVTLADGPVLNGISLTDPGWGSDQPLVSKGLLDVTKPPFSADPTGVTDATDAIQWAVDAGRKHYLTVFFPSGRYKITKTIAVVQPEKMFVTTVGQPNCNEMREIIGAKTSEKQHCARTAPVVMQGTKAGSTRPQLFVPSGINFKGPVVQLHNPIDENINMNQEFLGIDIRIEEGNPEAIGVYARGAQGVTVQDVVIYAGTAAIGIEGGAGSGGSHIGVTVIGGQIGMKVGSAQPGPTLTSIRLVNQSVSALVYQHPGRQTLSVTGLVVEAALDATGPAIDAGAALSLVDARISRVATSGNAASTAIAASQLCSLFLQNVWIRDFTVAVALANGTRLPGGAAIETPWAHFRLLAAASSDPQIPGLKSDAFVDGVAQSEAVLDRADAAAVPSEDVYMKHLWGDDTPTWESAGACFAKSYGARGILWIDDTEALQAMLDDPKCLVSVLEKGYFAVSKPLTLAPNAALVGVGPIYSNLVPHPDVAAPIAPGEEPWPLLRTSATATSTASVVAMSMLVWRQTNATYAFHWRSGGGLWRRAHIDRTDLDFRKHVPAYYNIPLSVMDGHGGGRFYNFYQENWDYQGPKYRHLLIQDTDSPFICYHCNLEHSQGEANLEIRGANAPIRLYGFKGEGNYAQIWVADSADFEMSGYGGNASPFPATCYYPPGYAEYTPSILRVERVKKLLLANIVVQNQGTEFQCGIFDTGFAGTFYSPSSYSVLFETVGEQNVTIEPMQWPHFYARDAPISGELQSIFM